jgi:tetratricopeptide (TPR) repeat protein
MRYPGLVWCLVLFCAVPVRSADEAWVKVQTPHFLVLSNGSQTDAREVATNFEQVHAVFAEIFPKLRTEASAETIVLAVKDERTFVELVPAEKKIAQNIGGQFFKGWEKDYVLVRLDVRGEGRVVVYHEYIHKLLHLNFTRLPTWLDEGLAEFFGNTEVRKDQALIGIPSPRVGVLRSRAPLPLQTLLSVRPNLGDASEASMFYAEAWCLTHFLMVGQGTSGIDRMNSYLASLQKGADAQKAFEEAFGDPKQIENQLLGYVSHFAFSALVMKSPPKIDAEAFQSTAMTAAETNARLAEVHMRFGEPDVAATQLSAALSADPQSALAHENMAFLNFRQGRDGDAKNEFDKAVTLDPHSFLAAYYQAMLAYHGKTDADSLTKLDAAMQHVLDLNPRFAPAVVVRSQILVLQQKLQAAFDTAVQAQRLEPDRAGYLTNMAAILLLGRNYPEAIKIADAVAERWYGSDSAEALAVSNRAHTLGNIQATPEEQAKQAEEMKYASGTTAVEGVVKSVVCEKSKPMQLVLESGGKDLAFQSAKMHGVGFTDTLWYGEDHFNSCFHLEGMNAVIRYKAPTDAAAPTEFQWLEIRDELIPLSEPAAN